MVKETYGGIPAHLPHPYPRYSGRIRNWDSFPQRCALGHSERLCLARVRITMEYIEHELLFETRSRTMCLLSTYVPVAPTGFALRNIF